MKGQLWSLKKILPYLQKIYGTTDTAYYTWYLFYTADCFSKDHKYTRAEDYFLRAKDIYEKKNGQNSPELPDCHQQAGGIVPSRGQICRGGEILPAVARCQPGPGSGRRVHNIRFPLSNLASLYQKSGSYQKAEPLFLKSLEISQKLFGPEDRRTAADINNIRYFLWWYGRLFRRAGSFFLRALKIREKDPGPDSPEYAISANNLGWAVLSKLAGMKRLSRSTLKHCPLSEKCDGDESPSYAISLNNLGALLPEHRKL